MTLERQDILEDWYAGNYKEILLHVQKKNPATGLLTDMDLTNCEVTYTLFSDKGQILVTLNSNDSNQIDLSDGAQANALIQVPGHCTTSLSGTYRHHATVVDDSGHEETVMVGTVNITKNYAHRPRKQSKRAYLLGG